MQIPITTDIADNVKHVRVAGSELSQQLFTDLTAFERDVENLSFTSDTPTTDIVENWYEEFRDRE